VGVSPGVAVGRALPWQPRAEREPQRQPRAGATAADEIARFEAARARARDELHTLRSRLMTRLGESYAAILDAQTLLVDDPALVAEVERRVRTEGVSASYAVHAAIETYLARFDSIEDRYAPFDIRRIKAGEILGRRGELERQSCSSECS
jgi:phosphotransferase system enzyme I (PtsI)